MLAGCSAQAFAALVWGPQSSAPSFLATRWTLGGRARNTSSGMHSVGVPVNALWEC